MNGREWRVRKVAVGDYVADKYTCDKPTGEQVGASDKAMLEYILQGKGLKRASAADAKAARCLQLWR